MTSPTIPNTSTSGTVGVPSPLAVACESADGTTFTPAAADAVQQMSMVNIAAQMRWMLDLIAQALSMAPDSTGRLRVNIDATGGAQTLGTVSTVTSVTAVAQLTKIGTIGPDPSQMVFDAMQNAWANSVMPCIARS